MPTAIRAKMISPSVTKAQGAYHQLKQVLVSGTFKLGEHLVEAMLCQSPGLRPGSGSATAIAQWGKRLLQIGASRRNGSANATRDQTEAGLRMKARVCIDYRKLTEVRPQPPARLELAAA